MNRCLVWGLGGSWAQELLFLWSWGISPSSVDVFANLETLWTPYSRDFMGASTHKHHQLLIPFLFLPPFWRMGCRADKSRLNHGFVFQPPAGANQEPTQSPLNRTKDLPVLYPLRKDKGFRSSVLTNPHAHQRESRWQVQCLHPMEFYAAIKTNEPQCYTMQQNEWIIAKSEKNRVLSSYI